MAGSPNVAEEGLVARGTGASPANRPIDQAPPFVASVHAGEGAGAPALMGEAQAQALRYIAPP